MTYAYIYITIFLILLCQYGNSAKKHSTLISYKKIRSHHSGPTRLQYNHRMHYRSKRFIRRYLINDCEVSDWSEWSECDAYCGPGHSQRSRMLFSHPVGMNVHKDGPNTMEIRTCIGQTCEDACKATEWSDWNECSATCGLGTRIKSRSAAEKDPHPMCSRLQLTKYDKCFIAPCEEINCNNLKWTEWSLCDPSCGHGQQERHRFDQSQTIECKADVRPCKTAECNRDCEVSEWDAWSKCDLQCKKQRIRKKLHDESGHGMSCESMSFVENENCGDDCEPCRNTEWTDWSSCSVDLPCHNGTMLRIRHRKEPTLDKCIVRMQKDYKECTVVKGCNKDCVYSKWSAWSSCINLSCIVDLLSVRTRTILQTSLGDGTSCNSNYLKEEKLCTVSSTCSQGKLHEEAAVQRAITPSNEAHETDAIEANEMNIRNVDNESKITKSAKKEETIRSFAKTSIGSIACCIKSTSLKYIFPIALSAYLRHLFLS